MPCCARFCSLLSVFLARSLPSVWACAALLERDRGLSPSMRRKKSLWGKLPGSHGPFSKTLMSSSMINCWQERTTKASVLQNGPPLNLDMFSFWFPFKALKKLGTSPKKKDEPPTPGPIIFFLEMVRTFFFLVATWLHRCGGGGGGIILRLASSANRRNVDKALFFVLLDACSFLLGFQR